ncbi:MAG TPA: hypothetical protein VJU86_10885 [Pyrinomonadaceae bacterium]|nr:hypothetical protein [Pyrinomonadaceae bacterium]
MTKTKAAPVKKRAVRVEPEPELQGLASLSDEEREVLNWTRGRRLNEFKKVNPDLTSKVLETKIMYIETITVEGGEILDALRLNPTLSWEKVRDIFLGGVVDGYTSTFHGLDGIEYPEHFWKATIENERDKLSWLT